MTSIIQSLRFFSRYGLSLTALFLLAAVSSEIVAFYLHQSLATSGELRTGLVDLLTSALIEPFAIGAAIFFIESRDQGGKLSLYNSFMKSASIYFQLVISYLLVLVMVMLGLSLYLIPGGYLLYRLMFVEYRVVLEGEQPMTAIRASFSQTKGQWPLLIVPFITLLITLLSSQALVGYLLMSQQESSDLWLQVLSGVLEAPFMAFSVVVGFRLFSLTR